MRALVIGEQRHSDSVDAAVNMKRRNTVKPSSVHPFDPVQFQPVCVAGCTA